MQRRQAIAGLLGAALTTGARRSVLTGLDTLVAEGFARLRGKRVGLVTNHTGIDRARSRNVRLFEAAGIEIGALFSPEHGPMGSEDHDFVLGAVDAVSGVPIYSLYNGPTRRPRQEWLAGLDALVFDIADVGARFFTYATTMAYCMETAAQAGLAFFVLDRPNPITGRRVEGPMLDASNRSFVGYWPLPVRHGMTIGETALLFNAEARIGAQLTVVRMHGWRRRDWLDETGAPWINPSPNLRSVHQALLYPGLALLEYTPHYSVGRGTDTPFEVIGARFIRAHELAATLSAARIQGVRIDPAHFSPRTGPLANEQVEGVRFAVTHRNRFDSTRLGLELAVALQRLYPGQIDFAVNRRLIGNDRVIDALAGGASAVEVRALAAIGLDRFRRVRERYLLYR
jgi:uncharacterized protein YbbC (DUF1343 family)